MLNDELLQIMPGMKCTEGKGSALGVWVSIREYCDKGMRISLPSVFHSNCEEITTAAHQITSYN